ncbi:hypothetical protein J7K50_01255 [bacterium]|nr:hypothetical protein [bacterium]
MSKLRITPKVFFDENGEPKDVLIPVSQYRRLLERLEDFEDARALDRAIKNAKKFIPADEVWDELERAGKL